MPSALSMTNLFTCLLFCALSGTGADLTAVPFRQAGSSLDPSIQNETDHAARQASEWLTRHQNRDGSWGSASNTLRDTSIALLALTAADRATASDAQTRAALWLAQTATNQVSDLETLAWRLLALGSALRDTPDRAGILRTFATAPQAPADGAPAPCAQTLWDEALAVAGLTPRPPEAAADKRDRLAQIAAAWPPSPDTSTADFWRLCHLINRAGQGQLTRGNTPLDWRTDVAQRLINSQRSSPEGGGFWPVRSGGTPITETALGLLALLEL